MHYTAVKALYVKTGLCALAFLFFASMTPRANAGDLDSTGALLSMCKSNGDGRAYCLGYISGTAAVMEQVALSTSGQFHAMMGMCVSAPYPSGNAEVAAFISWAEQNQQLWNQPSAVGVMLALDSTWHCKE